MRVNADRASCSLYSCRGEGWKLPFRSTRSGPERPPGPVAVRMISDVVSKKFMNTCVEIEFTARSTGPPDTLVDFHAGTGPEHSVQVRDAVRAAGVPLLVWGKTVYNSDGTARTLGSTTGGPAEPAPFE